MLALEERDRIDFGKLATDATHKLHREVEKSPVSPLMTPTNPHRRTLLRSLQAFAKKRGGEGTAFVTFTTKAITVEDRLTNNGPHTYEVEFRNGRVSVKHAAASYAG